MLFQSFPENDTSKIPCFKAIIHSTVEETNIISIIDAVATAIILNIDCCKQTTKTVSGLVVFHSGRKLFGCG